MATQASGARPDRRPRFRRCPAFQSKISSARIAGVPWIARRPGHTVPRYVEALRMPDLTLKSGLFGASVLLLTRNHPASPIDSRAGQLDVSEFPKLLGQSNSQ